MRIEGGVGGVPSCDQQLKKSNPCPKGTRDRRDMTDWLARALVDSAKDKRMKDVKEANKRAHGKFSAYMQFVGLVGNDAYYDVKWNIRDTLRSDTVKLGDNWYEFSTIGNIMYGYYGSSAEFTAVELHMGAGVAQVNDFQLHLRGKSKHPESPAELGPHDSPFYGDSADDYYAVNLGIELWETYGEDLTEKDLAAALDYNAHRKPLALGAVPSGGCVPTTGKYKTDEFYNSK